MAFSSFDKNKNLSWVPYPLLHCQLAAKCCEMSRGAEGIPLGLLVQLVLHNDMKLPVWAMLSMSGHQAWPSIGLLVLIFRCRRSTGWHLHKVLWNRWMGNSIFFLGGCARRWGASSELAVAKGVGRNLGLGKDSDFNILSVLWTPEQP